MTLRNAEFHIFSVCMYVRMHVLTLKAIAFTTCDQIFTYVCMYACMYVQDGRSCLYTAIHKNRFEVVDYLFDIGCKELILLTDQVSLFPFCSVCVCVLYICMYGARS
jgi:hypothetical protein